MKIIIIGPPGSGKGTQANLLANKLNLAHISIGDILRRYIEEGAELGMLLKNPMISGYLIPDDIVFSILKNRLEEVSSNKGFILDGFPRTMVQAKYLDEYLKTKKIGLNIAVYLYLDDDTIYKRNLGRRFCAKCKRDYNMYFEPPQQDELCDICGSILAQRHDSLPKVIHNRLIEYKTRTIPVIEYYNRKGLLFEVDGNETKKEIHRKIIKKLQEI